MRIKRISNFLKGLITSIEDYSIPDGAASNILNWKYLGDKIELRKGYQALGSVTETLGPELLENGDFDGNADEWTLGAGWTYDNNNVVHTPGDTEKLYQEFDSEDENYRLSLTIGGTTGSVRVDIGNVDDEGGSQFDAGAGAVELTVGGNPGEVFYITPSTDFDGAISAISTKQILPDSIGEVTGLHVTFKADGTQIPYPKRGRKLEYYDTATNDWIEVGTDLFPAAAEDDEASFANYASLAGNQMFICSPNSGPYKIMTANPGSYTDLTDPAKNFQGYIKIKQNRMTLRNRNKDKTGEYGSYVDAAAYTTVTAEVTASLSGTLGFKAGGSVRTCFAVTITITGTGEVYTDDYNGILTGSLGGTGTINYTTGAYTLSNAGVGTADYQWENSNNTGITDFTKSSPRTAGQGFVFRQDDGGGTNQMALSYGDVEFCFHRLKTWALTLTSDDTNATNLIYRDNVGIPNWRAAVATGDGVYYVDDYEQTEPKFRLLTLNNISTQVIPLPVSDQLNLQDYRFDKAASIEWGELILFACRHKDSTVNNAVFAYNKRLGLWEKHDYFVSCFAIYNGALIAGESISSNVVELFSGFDDGGASIPNYWIGNLTNLDIEELKRLRRFWVQGEISRDQTLNIWMSFDRGAFVLVGTQNGTDDNVDSTSRSVIGSDVIGQSTLGGRTSANVYNYIKEIKLTQGKFYDVKVKFEAVELGFCSVSSYTYHDILLKGPKLPIRYRDN